MLKFFRYILILLVTSIYSVASFAQILKDPTVWKVEAKKKKGNQYELVFHFTTTDEHWHVYDLVPGGDGTMIAPEFHPAKSTHYKVSGKVRSEGKRIDETIEDIGTIHYFHKADFIVPVTVDTNGTIKGTYMYQTCNEQTCLPAKTKPFSVDINDPELPNAASTETAATTNATDTTATTTDTSKKAEVVATTSTGSDTPEQPKAESENKSLWWLFFAALLGGLLAVLTPCVYSMIPITVSFFTKRSKTRAEGIRNAIYYSLSIIIIFTLLGIIISATFGANALNNLSTNWIANLFFFAIFVIFGISFLGAFEITLPSSWTSKTDSKAGLTSFGGIFFMALTLVIVSFSCTGPIIGPLLVLTSKGGIVGPAVGMFGFSMGLALPFALFAVFPGMLNKMATSGGWLNQVKVTLGFVELMLAMKFLSNADLARGWRLLDREIFIAIWIVLSILLGLYLLGKLKLSHDDAPAKNIYGQEYVGLFKLFLAIASFTFAVYLLPGMWGAPLNGMSQFVPPIGTQDFVLSEGGGGSASTGGEATVNSGVAPNKYVQEMKIYEAPVVKNLGLVTYFNYEEALAAAKVLHKPVMLDFTGINCVNCRKMESQVWSKPEVAKRLKEDFIVASLYCDYDKTELPKNEQYYSKVLGSQVVTVGDRNEDIQASQFGANAQPFYFYVDENG
ncbi:MAG: cytochrome c biogenesis protein CcdA, partial [Flavipsychrobacter sp.]